MQDNTVAGAATVSLPLTLDRSSVILAKDTIADTLVEVGTMKFAVPFSPFCNHCLSLQRDQYLSGGLILAVVGWVALHPPPKPPNLPSAYRAHLRGRFLVEERAPYARRPVWLDTRQGMYYFYTDPLYENTPNGRLIDLKKARAQGYRSRAEMCLR
jgi:hypothetical protein